MKKWHLEGIVIVDRRCGKLHIPGPGQQTLWARLAETRDDHEFFLTRMMRAVRARVQRLS
jgi:hypothetical protein